MKRGPVADVPSELTCRVLHDDEPELVLLSFSPSGNARLTGAECEVAMALIRGLSNDAIARERGVAVRTVANQVAALLKKLDVSSRVELVARITAADFV